MRANSNTLVVGIFTSARPSAFSSPIATLGTKTLLRLQLLKTCPATLAHHNGFRFNDWLRLRPTQPARRRPGHIGKPTGSIQQIVRSGVIDAINVRTLRKATLTEQTLAANRRITELASSVTVTGR